MSGRKGKGAHFTWLKEHVSHTGDDCLIWPFNRMPVKGYGQVGYLGKIWKAHRLMCVMVHGEPPPGKQAAHSCGNGHLACVNPRHLSWKTPRENRLDSNLHGTGNVPKPRRLTFDQVQEIRASEGTQQELAEKYGVHPDTIGRIRRGEQWANPRSTLTLEQIARLKELHGTMSTTDMAREIGIKRSVADNFFRRKTFAGLNS